MTWVDQAACARAVAEGWAEPDDWFPPRGQPNWKAKSVCAQCPVVAECLTFSRTLPANEQQYGVWGGFSGMERRPDTARKRRCWDCETPVKTRTLYCEGCASARRQQQRRRYDAKRVRERARNRAVAQWVKV